VRLTRVELTPLALALRTPLRTARATYAQREGFVLRLHDEAGRVGQGEATPLAEFGTESLAHCEAALRSARLEGQVCGTQLEEVSALLAGWTLPAARHAVELALLDLLAQRRGLPLARLLSPGARRSLQVNALLSARSPGELAAEARGAARQGYGTLKVKVGGAPVEEDVARLAALRDAVGNGPLLRVDANGAWGADEALEALERLSAFRLALCEQPVPAGDLEGWRRVSAAAPCALGADESLALPAVLEALLASGAAQVLVLKPMVLGGLLPALALARRAAAQGMEAFVTSSLDGVVARAGAAQLAAALPSGALASGLAVGQLFRDEVPHAYSPARGEIALPELAGLGLGGEAR
jgi:o-succinylbenzoate synthase